MSTWYNPSTWFMSEPEPTRANDEALRARYAPGGDIHAELSSRYGRDNADRVWNTFQNGGDVAQLLGELKSGPAKGSSSTLVNFFDQVTTDPLAAPLESANRQIGNVAANILKNPWVLLLVVLVVVYLVVRLGGLLGIKKRITG